MKILVASDIHGSAYYCEKLLEAFDREQADRLLLLGDILYHGPRNDLPRDYDPKRVAPMLNSRRERIACVRGNCDSEVDQMVLEFPILSDSYILALGNRMVFATHGHVWHPDNLPPLCPGDILLNGHTHVPACESVGEVLYANPGSVSLPKNDSWRGYLLLEEIGLTWKTLEGSVCMEHPL